MEAFVVVVLFQLIGLVGAGIDGTHWTYTEGSLDQKHWADDYPACGGRMQSPIDIQRRSVKYNKRLLQLKLEGYDEIAKGNFTMVNNGHTVLINLPPTMKITKGLPGSFTAVQMHLHWGGWDLEASGSEHTVDGIRYMAELHVVHYNSDKYPTFEDAKDKPDGLAVLAFFYEDGHFENTYYSDFISNLAKVKYAGQSMTFTKLNVRSMLPENLSHFFRYHGSLTTPPCYESTIWTVFDTPITLSVNQIRKLESTLMDLENKTLWNDYRMAQPLNDRVVEASFFPRLAKGSFCRQEEIESKLSSIESMISSLGKQLDKGTIKAAKPGKKGPQALAPLALHFPERNTESYVVVHTEHPMDLDSFTACMKVRTTSAHVHTVLSYSTLDNDNELVISTGSEVGLWIGNEFINMPNDHRSKDWTTYCVTWSSHTGGAELWVNSLVFAERYLKAGYTIVPGGDLILGKDQDGFLGISDSDAFVGYMADVNMWNYVLSESEIREQNPCLNSSAKGNVLSWGLTRIALYGGVIMEPSSGCP
ncbi:carbonic anhydrase 6 isoform X1 [Denticeps clupeoides]|uniref:Carbonic anhydrase n=1 Tax=Denticeps clupeoides TaxID=299321 RepID=A0AAY4DZ62_9TELE|nr:carbonic anhydrase 6 isoform X1 [Denticeps clupeoides]